MLCWCIRKLKTLALIGAKNVTKLFIGERKGINKGNDMHKYADSPLHDKTSHSQRLYKI